MKNILLLLMISILAKMNSYSQDTINNETSGCLYQTTKSGLYNGSVHLNYSTDTLAISGEIIANCGATHIAIYERINDTLYVSTMDTGQMTTCDCMFHFNIKLKVSQSDSIVRFNSDLYKNGVYSSIRKINLDSELIQLTPNPTIGIVRIDRASNILINNINVLDISGRLIKTQSYKNDNIDLVGLNSGVYFILFNISGGESIIKQIIKK